MLRRRTSNNASHHLQQRLLMTSLFSSALPLSSKRTKSTNSYRTNTNNNNNQVNSDNSTSSSTSSSSATLVRKTLEDQEERYRRIRQQARRYFLQKPPQQQQSRQNELSKNNIDDDGHSHLYELHQQIEAFMKETQQQQQDRFFTLSHALKTTFERVKRNHVARLLLASIARGHYDDWPLAFKEKIFSCPLDVAVDHMVDEQQIHNNKDSITSAAAAREKFIRKELTQMFGGLLSDLVLNSEKRQAKKLGLSSSTTTAAKQQQNQNSALDELANVKKSKNNKKKHLQQAALAKSISKTPPQTKYKWVGWENERKERIAEASYSSSSSSPKNKTSSDKKNILLNKKGKMLSRKIVNPTRPPKILRHFLRLCWPKRTSANRRRFKRRTSQHNKIRRQKIISLLVGPSRKATRSSSSSSPHVISRLEYGFSFLAFHLRLLEQQRKPSSTSTSKKNSSSAHQRRNEAAQNIVEASARLYFLLKNVETLSRLVSEDTKDNFFIQSLSPSSFNNTTAGTEGPNFVIERSSLIASNSHRNSNQQLFLSHPYHLLDLHPRLTSQKVVYRLPTSSSSSSSSTVLKQQQQHEEEEFVDLCPSYSMFKRVRDCESLVFPELHQAEEEEITVNNINNKLKNDDDTSISHDRRKKQSSNNNNNNNKMKKTQSLKSIMKDKSSSSSTSAKSNNKTKKQQKEQEILRQLDLLDSIVDEDGEFSIGGGSNNNNTSDDSFEISFDFDKDDVLSSSAKKEKPVEKKNNNKKKTDKENLSSSSSPSPKLQAQNELKTLLSGLPLLDGGERLAPAILLHRSQELENVVRGCILNASSSKEHLQNSSNHQQQKQLTSFSSTTSNNINSKSEEQKQQELIFGDDNQITGGTSLSSNPLLSCEDIGADDDDFIISPQQQRKMSKNNNKKTLLDQMDEEDQLIFSSPGSSANGNHDVDVEEDLILKSHSVEDDGFDPAILEIAQKLHGKTRNINNNKIHHQKEQQQHNIDSDFDEDVDDDLLSTAGNNNNKNDLLDDLFEIDDDAYLLSKQQVKADREFAILEQQQTRASTFEKELTPLFFSVPIKLLFDHAEAVVKFLKEQNESSSPSCVLNDSNCRVVINRCDSPFSASSSSIKWWAFDVRRSFQNSYMKRVSHNEVTKFFFDYASLLKQHEANEMHQEIRRKAEEERKKKRTHLLASSSGAKRIAGSQLSGILPGGLNTASSSSTSPKQQHQELSSSLLLSYDDSENVDEDNLVVLDKDLDENDETRMLKEAEKIEARKKKLDDFYIKFHENLWKRIVVFDENEVMRSAAAASTMMMMRNSKQQQQQVKFASTVTSTIAQRVKSRGELYELAKQDAFTNRDKNENDQQKHFDLCFARVLNAVMVAKY